MSKISGRRVALLAVLVGSMVMFEAVGQVKPAPASHVAVKFALAVDTTFQKGVHGKLPPHISTLLNLTREEECQVLQNVVRTGSLVQGMDVSATNKKDVVLFTVDETANEQSLYLTSPQGTLRKVVRVKAGVGDAVRITDNEQSAFKKERQFWVDRLVPSGGAAK